MKYIAHIKEKWGQLDEAWRVAIVAFLVLRCFYAIWSWVILTVQPVAVHYIEIDERPAVVFLSLRTNQTFTYLTEVAGNDLSFRAIDDKTVVDLQTGSRWTISSGTALEGAYQGRRLSPADTPVSMFPYVSGRPYPDPWLAMWQRFDANWYLSIAEYGYQSYPGTEHFPPFYPLLVSLTLPVIGNSFIAGLVVSHLSALFAIKLLFDLFNEWDNSLSRQTLLYFLIFPTTFFLFSIYSESLFLLLALLALRAMQRQSWVWAGFWIFCATLTRLQGVALGIPLLYLIFQDRPFLRKFQHWISLGIAGSGMLFYFYLRSVISTDAVVPFTESAFPTRLAPSWETYGYAVQTLLSGTADYIDVLNLLTATILVILLILGWNKMPFEYALYSATSLLIVTARVVEGQPLSGMLRFALTLFPIFYIISLAGNNPWRRRVIIYACLALNLYLSADFFSWGWVA